MFGLQDTRRNFFLPFGYYSLSVMGARYVRNNQEAIYC